MRIGKLDNEVLNELILSKFPHFRKEVVCSPKIGVDCAAVQLGGRLAVMSTDPITAATEHIGALSVHINCNDAAAAGAEPVGLLVTLLVPPTATEADIAAIADELSAAAKAANVEVIGGHTEVTDAVTRIVTCTTVLAKAGEKGMLTPAGVKEGDAIVLTKWAGLEGSAIIAAEYANRLSTLDKAEIAEAKEYMNMVSVVKEGLFAYSAGAHAMHDVTEGGVLGAAWEMSESSAVGLEIDPDKVPFTSTTVKMCDELGIDKLRLLSSGSMIIACPDGEAMVNGLKSLGINATIIGKACGKGARFANGLPITPPGADELYKVK